MLRKLQNILFRKSYSGNNQESRKKGSFFQFKNVSYKRVSMYATMMFCVYLGFTKDNKQQLQFIGHKTDLNQRLFFTNKELCQTSYSKSLVLRNKWLQRIYSLYFETYKIINVESQQFDNEGVIRTFPKQNYNLKGQENLPALIVVGGTESFDQLMRDMMLSAEKQKFEVFGVNMKDFHNEENFLKLIDHIKKQSKAKNFYCVGIEYGANLMTIAAAKNPNLFNAIASIGNPLNLEYSQKNLQNSLFGKFIMRSIITGKLKSFELIEKGKGQLNLPEDRNLYNIDKVIYKLKQEELLDFKTRRSCVHYLENLKVHSLFISSRQDPFSKITKQIQSKAEINPHLLFISTKSGGHTEFFYSLNNYRWPPVVIAKHFRIVDHLLSNNPQLFKLQ